MEQQTLPRVGAVALTAEEVELLKEDEARRAAYIEVGAGLLGAAVWREVVGSLRGGGGVC